MKTFLRILSSVLIIFSVSMAIKQGLEMITGDPQMLSMFSHWYFNETAVKITGVITIVTALLILFQRTFVAGSVIMIFIMLMIFCFQMIDRNVTGVLIQLPFVLLNLAIIFLGHPFSKNP